MLTMTVGHFKSHFSEVLDLVKHGEDIVISYGKKRKRLRYWCPLIVMKARCNALLAY